MAAAPRETAGIDADAGFATVWRAAAAFAGWLTEEQARLLWDEAWRLAPVSTVVEIGSHQGRSTAVLARALPPGARLVAVDPFVGGRFGGPATRERFDRHMAALGLTDIVDLVVDRSTAVRPGWTETIDLLYIDGKHDYWTVSDDLRWRAFLPPGGRLLVHDSFSSIGVTLALLRHGLGAPDLAYVGRVGSLARFERRRPRPAERLRLLGELPWWLRNVAIKITLRARRLTSRDVPPDPY